MTQLDAMSLACQSVYSNKVIAALRDYRARLVDQSGLRKPADETADQEANLRSAVEAAINAGARAG